jgi:uncharacterized membrane protein
VINENWIYLGTAIGAAGAAVYLRDTWRGTTQPNRVTWLLWAVAPLLAAAVEFNEGVGLRALPTFMVGFMPLLIFIGSFHNSASVWKVRRMDYACGAVSVIGTIVWLVTRDGVLAISAAIAADFLAGIPTLMKSWTHPGSETVHTYIGAVISMVILLLTVDHWTFDVVAFPLFVACVASVESVLVGLEIGPRFRLFRHPGAGSAAPAEGMTR